jgi:hypothetical protein
MEVWEPIKNYPNYQVSNLGRVKSLERKQFNNLTKTISVYKEKNISSWITKTGYVQLRLYNNGVKINLSIHRLVATAFISNPENKPCVNHKNGIKNDNKVENLEWCTGSENMKHAYKTRLQLPVCGIKHGLSKLTQKDVLEIKKSNLPQSKLSFIYKISQSVISEIKNNKSWKHIDSFS